ncbi:MAG: hypothetical protein H7Y33_10885 [Cytophagales bacterium]|nr:hypothetical protein [Rhizobacter sp.]
MQIPFWKSLIIGWLLVCASLLSGCGAVRFAYGQGPDLSYWWLDGYADFNDIQTPRVRDALSDWFRWHRATQLPDYAQFLARAQVQAAESVTPAQVCRLYDEALTRIDPMIERALPAAVDAVQSLTLAQIVHMERKYAKVNVEFRDDYLQSNPAKRLQESVKRAVDRAEMLYGSLDATQLELLTRAIAASPFDPQLWLNERMLRQQDVLKTLRRLVTERAPADQTQAALRVLVLHAQRSPREVYLRYQERLSQYNCKLAAQLHNGTSREQRLAAVKKLKSWEEDARALSGDTVKSP